MRGGISYISHRHSKANNKYLSNYDADLETKYLMYLDANKFRPTLPNGEIKNAPLTSSAAEARLKLYLTIQYNTIQ